jgi:hypothetical protein
VNKAVFLVPTIGFPSLGLIKRMCSKTEDVVLQGMMVRGALLDGLKGDGKGAFFVISAENQCDAVSNIVAVQNSGEIIVGFDGLTVDGEDHIP